MGLAVRLVVRVIDTPAELERDVWPRDFFVEKGGEAALIDGGRERLFTNRVEGAIEEPAASASFQPPDRAM
jgi:hypothetical protein